MKIQLTKALITRPGERVAEAMSIALAAHQHQRDKAGDPYLLHVLRVAGKLAAYGEEATIVALLHDVIEDSDFTVEEIRATFGASTAADVDALTRRGEPETYVEYIGRVIDRGGLAVKVKRYDLRDHLSRKESLSESHRVRYEAALDRLAEAS